MNMFTSDTPMSVPSDQDGSVRQLRATELGLRRTLIKCGSLTSTKGSLVKQFQTEFVALLDVAHGFACSSGTGAIHAAIAALDPLPGDEIITSAISDMATITPITNQSAIPVFADIDAKTGNMTADAIARVITPKTKAIIVTHLFGNPCEMHAIMTLAETHGIPVIEDCAQAYGARFDGKTLGTFGAIGCFRLQQSKHHTASDIGVVVTNDTTLALRLRLFFRCAREGGHQRHDLRIAAQNGRMTELQASAVLTQLSKLEHSTSQRKENAAALINMISGVKGVQLIPVEDGAENGYWRFALHVPESHGGPEALATALSAIDVASTQLHASDAPASYAGAHAFLKSVLVLSWDERLQPVHIRQIAKVVADCVSEPHVPKKHDQLYAALSKTVFL